MTQEAPVDVPGRERVLDLEDPYRQNYISHGQILSLPVTAGPVTGVEGPPGILNPPRLTAEQAANMENIIATPPEKEVVRTPHDQSIAYYQRQPGIEISGSKEAQDKIKRDVENLQRIVPPGSTAQDYVNIYRDPSLAGVTGDGGGGDGGGLGDQGIMSAPVVAETEAAGTDLAAVREAAIADAATKSGLPFEHYYVGGDPTPEQEKFMREHQAAASMVGKPAWPISPVMDPDRMSEIRNQQIAAGVPEEGLIGNFDFRMTTAADGGRIGYYDGGTTRQRYGLGSLVKKAFKAVKKIAKSPVGKAALLAGLGIMGGKAMQGASWKKFLPKLIGTQASTSAAWPGGRERFLGNTTGWLGKLLLKKGAPSWSLANLSPMKGIGWLSMLPFLTQGKEKQTGWAGNYGEGIDPEAIRRAVLAGGVDRAKYPFLQESQYEISIPTRITICS